jgi:hypothetical protein
MSRDAAFHIFAFVVGVLLPAAGMIACCFFYRLESLSWPAQLDVGLATSGVGT